jgi:hypothetical protein
MTELLVKRRIPGKLVKEVLRPLHGIKITKTRRGKFEVIYKDSAFRLKEIEQNWALLLEENNCLEDFEEIKIIGNIFEKEVDNSTGL